MRFSDLFHRINKISILSPSHSNALLLCGLCLGMLAFGACGEPSPTSAIEKQQEENPFFVCDMLSNKIHSIGFVMKINNRKPQVIRDETLDFYQANDYQVAWDQSNAEQVLDLLYKSNEHGFEPSNYRAVEIDTLIREIFVDKKYSGEEALLRQLDLDIILTASALSYITDVSYGRYSHKWDLKNKTTDLSQKLIDAFHSESLGEAVAGVVARPGSYKGLASALKHYRQIAENGGLQKVEAGTLSSKKETKSSKQLAKLLKQTQDYDEENASGSFTPALKEALHKFQERNGLVASNSLNKSTLKALNRPIDEIISLLTLNMDRHRWLPDELGEKYVFVNIPDFKVDIVEKEKSILDMRVVVGDVTSPTPVFTEDMTHVVFSPVWNIPTSISHEQILDYLHHNPGFIYVSDVEVYHKGEKITDPYAVDWKEAQNNRRDYSFKQKPTNQNALGDVKFMFPNKHAVYLHDTPSKDAFYQRYRAESAGCVRVEKPAEMAVALLEDKGWSLGGVQKAMNGTKQKYTYLSKPVPVYLYYFTAWVDESGTLQFRSDVYGQDRRQLKTLETS